MDNIDKFVIWIIQFTYDFLVGPWILLREYVDLIFFVFFFGAYTLNNSICLLVKYYFHSV